MSENAKKFMEGNIAIAEGAIAAGARFYAGYPISPSSEIAEHSAEMLPEYGGMYVQMEDEISSIAALLGASAAGKKVYTATSGPGFSLMQENLGLAIMCEAPMVIIDVQRSGPATGAATKPAQADFMQARWGTHGDHSIIALAPSSVQDCFDLTVTAFNLSERYRTPVVLLADAIIGKMCETVELRTFDESELEYRPQPEPGSDPKDYRPYSYDSLVISPMAPIGSPCLTRSTGSTHDERGEFMPTQELIDKSTRYLTNKIERNRANISMVRRYGLDDAELVFVTFGCSVRSAMGAMDILREQGIKAGILQLITVWPLPEEEIREVLSSVKMVVVPELNLGQLAGEVKRLNDYGCDVIQVNKVDGTILTPNEIIAEIKEVAR